MGRAADLNAVSDGSWRQSKTSIVLSPDATRKGLYRMSEDEKAQFVHLDVIFPVLHGLYGEDGTVQGLFKLAGIRLLDVVSLHQLLVWISFTQRL